ncbi:hypothetical protein ACJX0J_009446 [Zea mays]
MFVAVHLQVAARARRQILFYNKDVITKQKLWKIAYEHIGLLFWIRMASKLTFLRSTKISIVCSLNSHNIIVPSLRVSIFYISLNHQAHHWKTILILFKESKTPAPSNINYNIFEGGIGDNIF